MEEDSRSKGNQERLQAREFLKNENLEFFVNHLCKLLKSAIWNRLTEF